MTLKDTLAKTVKFFEAKGIDNPRVDAEYLFNHALGLSRMDLYVNFEKKLSESELETLRPLVKRRGEGEPVAHITGERGFYGLTFKVNSDVLIPRPETEILVDQVMDFVKKGECRESWNILDMGCGSGCIGMALAHQLKNAKVTSVDISAEAIAVAEENRQILGLQEQVVLVNGNVLDFDGSEYDIIVANPPYISEDDEHVSSEVKASEPALALFSGDGGLKDPMAWIEKAKPMLRDSGLFVMEMGYDQGEALEKRAREIFSDSYRVEVIKDYNNFDRVLLIEL